jgi:hypothetical protein
MRSFFSPQKIRQFNLKTRYYSEEKERVEELKRRIGEVQASDEVREERIREAYARKRPRRNKPNNKLLHGSKLLIYIFLVLLLVLLISNVKWLLF